MGAILSKFWGNKSHNSNHDQPQLAIVGPPPRLPLPPPPIPSRPPVSSSSSSSPPQHPPPPPPSTEKPSDGGEDKSSSSHHGRKSSKKQQQQQQRQLQDQERQSGHNLEKNLQKNVLPLSNQSFIYKTVFEANVSDGKANEEEERLKASEAPGPFEIETDLLSPEVEEAVIKIQANVRGYLTRKLYRGVTPEPDRSVEPSQQPDIQSSSTSVATNQEPIERSNDQPRSSSGILAPPPSFSDTPKEPPLNDVDNKNETAANQGKRIAEKLIELERQVSQQAINNEPSESTVDDVITSHKDEDKSDSSTGKDNLKQSPIDLIGTELKIQSENNDREVNHDEISSSQHSLGIPSIDTSEVKGPEEAAIKIQAAFRGYQVRKTISRETSPCQTREGDEGGNNVHDEVHLRDKNGTSSTQDPERESILVLNQLEECLSQELMRSSINIEDETSLSSYSTDIDLNASLKSNVSLLTSTTKSSHDDDNTDLKVTSIGSGDLLTSLSTNNNQTEQTSIDDKQSIKIPDTIKSEIVNNEQIVGTSLFYSSATVNQVPLNIQTLNNNHSVDCLDSSSKIEDQIEMINTEPVLLVPINGIVDANDGLLKDDHSTEPVLIVQLNGIVDASQVTSSSDDQQVKEVKESLETIEIESGSTQFNEDTKFQVDSMASANEPPSLTDIKHSSEMKEPEVELESDMTATLVKSIDDGVYNQLIATTKDNSVNPPQVPKQITSSIPDVQPSLSDTSDKRNDFKDDDQLISSIDTPILESQQKVAKLLKEDSFGSDILILDDEKNDSLYDPFTDDLTTPMVMSNVQTSNVDVGQLTTSMTFVEDNLIQSVVDGAKKDEGLVLYEGNSKTIDSDTVKKAPDDNITEIKDDILVDLDESDDDDEDSQKRPIEEPKSPIIINIHRPSDAEEIEQIIAEKSRDLNESATQTKDQSIKEQPERQDESTDVPVVLPFIRDSDEKVQRINDSESEIQCDSSQPSDLVETKQSTIDNDAVPVQISTNPFLDQTDFDSDIASGKIDLTDQSSKNVQDDLKTQKDELQNFKSSESLCDEVHSSGIVLSTQSQADGQSALAESSSSPSSSAVNQPSVIVESIGYTEKNESPIEPANDDPDEDETASLPDSLALRLKERETRSRSPNPFGRKKRRHKKNRGGGANC